MAPTDGRLAMPEQQWNCRRGTPWTCARKWGRHL